MVVSVSWLTAASSRGPVSGAERRKSRHVATPHRDFFPITHADLHGLVFGIVLRKSP